MAGGSEVLLPASSFGRGGCGSALRAGLANDVVIRWWSPLYDNDARTLVQLGQPAWWPAAGLDRHNCAAGWPLQVYF